MLQSSSTQDICYEVYFTSSKCFFLLIRYSVHPYCLCCWSMAPGYQAAHLGLSQVMGESPSRRENNTLIRKQYMHLKAMKSNVIPLPYWNFVLIDNVPMGWDFCLNLTWEWRALFDEHSLLLYCWSCKIIFLKGHMVESLLNKTKTGKLLAMYLGCQGPFLCFEECSYNLQLQFAAL